MFSGWTQQWTDTRVISDPLNKMLDIVTVGKETVHAGLGS